MLLREVEYARPASVQEALRLLGENDGARALAGGQTLINVMKARAASPDVLVDLADLKELRGIELSADGTLELGAMTTYTDIIESAEARARPILGEVCTQIADVQVRNRGTIGGNVCSNDPTNHLPPLLVAIGATMTIVGEAGERDVSAEEFFLGVYMTAVGQGELLTKISVPPGKSDGFASVPIGKDGTCIVNVAASMDGGAPRLAIGCVDATPGSRQARIGRARRCARGSPGRRPRSAVGRARLSRLPATSGRDPRPARCRAGRRKELVEATSRKTITVDVNGQQYEREVDARRLLIHFVRDDLDLTGSHIGCDTGNCGACSMLVEGTLVKSCMMLAVQADGAKIETVEGLASEGELNGLQQAFSDHHALQCGYCTPGMLMSATALLRQNANPSDDEIRKGIQGNICRCTGYVNIVEAIKAAAQ